MLFDPANTLTGQRFRAADVLLKTPAPELCAGGGHAAGESGGLRVGPRGWPTPRRPRSGEV
jgi:hypothetical protein